MPSREELLDALEGLLFSDPKIVHSFQVGAEGSLRAALAPILVMSGRWEWAGTRGKCSRTIPPDCPPTKRVRIAVGIDADGDWWAGKNKRLLKQCDAVHFVVADIPVPQPPQTIEGKVSS